VTKVTPCARHVHLLDQTYRKFLYLNVSVSHSNSFILKNGVGPKIVTKKKEHQKTQLHVVVFFVEDRHALLSMLHTSVHLSVSCCHFFLTLSTFPSLETWLVPCTGNSNIAQRTPRSPIRIPTLDRLTSQNHTIHHQNLMVSPGTFKYVAFG